MTTYPCCEHCADDPVHDVAKDGHDLPCTRCSEKVMYTRGFQDGARSQEPSEWVQQQIEAAKDEIRHAVAVHHGPVTLGTGRKVCLTCYNPADPDDFYPWPCDTAKAVNLPEST